VTQPRRADTVTLLVNLAAPLRELVRILDTYPPDPASSDEMVTLRGSAAESLLARFIRGEIGVGTVMEWAKLLEGRTDVTYEPSAAPVLSRLIFRLANEDIHPPLTEEEAQTWIEKLRSQRT